MTYAQAVKKYGGYRPLANALGVAPTTVHSWRHRGIPVARQYQIETISGGKLKAAKRAAQ